MLVEAVVAEPGEVVETVARSLGRPMSLVGQLDVDVYRMRRGPAEHDPEPDLVVRAFGPGVAEQTVAAAAHVLEALVSTPFPAERCAGSPPVLPLGSGRHLLLTEFVELIPPPNPDFLLAWCAALLGRLATRAGTDLPQGGGWHRLGGTPSQEIDAALRLGGQVGSAVAEVVDTLAEADDGSGLPEALIHADLTPPNAVPRGDQAPVIIDWIGVGRGPRAWPLAWLLFAAGARRVRRSLDRYARATALSEEERFRLPAMMIARPLALDLWSVAHDRMSPQRAVTRCRAHRVRAEAIATALKGSGRLPARPRASAVTASRSPAAGEMITETVGGDGGREVSVYVPPQPPEAVVFAGDGQLLSGWGSDLVGAGVIPTLMVGVHRLADETQRLHEYSPVFDPQRFAAHERFFLRDVRQWVTSRFGVALPPRRTALFGVSAGAELALAMGLRHPDVFGTVLCASPAPAISHPPFYRAVFLAPTSSPARWSPSSATTQRAGRQRCAPRAPTSS